MKRVFMLLLILALMLLVSALAEDEILTGYRSDFSNDFDGWYPRSTGTAELENTGIFLKITGRTAAWNSPGRDFNLTPGQKYEFSFAVKQNDVDSAEFMVSVAHSKFGIESYENLAKATMKRGVWTVISGTYTPAAYDNYILYVETVANGTIDFMIKDISVEPSGIIYDHTLPSLKDTFSGYFDFGCALNNTQLLDKPRMEFVSKQFNIITHENEFKPDAVIDISASRALAKSDETAVAVTFTRAKSLLDYCKNNGLKLHGHVLVWHSQTPDAFFREGYSSTGAYVTREVMLKRMENYIRQVFEYTETNYPGVIVSWDVVNEAVADAGGVLRKSNWTNVVGQDFVNRAFEYARKYAPEGTLLYYNDYNTPMEPKLSAICKLLDSLIADGTIDGYGFQAHYSGNSPAPSSVRKAFELISGKNLKIRISEMDVGITDNSDLQKRIQAYRYKALFEIFIDYADHIEAVQLWGVTDDRSWRSDEYPLLFDEKARPKYAYYAVLETAGITE